MTTHPLLLAAACHQRNRLTRDEPLGATLTMPRDLVLDFARWTEQQFIHSPYGEQPDWYERPFKLMGLTISIADRHRPGSFL